MLRAYLNSETSEILCPLCKQNNFKIFRRDKLASRSFWYENNFPEKQYLNHCKCENCNQLFVYNTGRMNSIVS